MWQAPNLRRILFILYFKSFHHAIFFFLFRKSRTKPRNFWTTLKHCLYQMKKQANHTLRWNSCKAGKCQRQLKISSTVCLCVKEWSSYSQWPFGLCFLYWLHLTWHERRVVFSFCLFILSVKIINDVSTHFYKCYFCEQTCLSRHSCSFTNWEINIYPTRSLTVHWKKMYLLAGNEPAFTFSWETTHLLMRAITISARKSFQQGKVQSCILRSLHLSLRYFDVYIC